YPFGLRLGMRLSGAPDRFAARNLHPFAPGGVGLKRRASRPSRPRRQLRNWRHRAYGLIGAGLAASAPAPSSAQAPPAAPRAPTREEVERVRPRPDEQAPARLTVEGGIPRSPCPLADPAYAGIEFTLADVVFEDLKGLDPAALAP